MSLNGAFPGLHREENTKTNFSKRAEVPVYSFEKHQRMEETTTIYSPHVLILEGIFALYDPRVMDLMDMRVSTANAYILAVSIDHMTDLL